MWPGDGPGSSVALELAALDDRLRAAQRDAATTMGAIVAMIAVLAWVSGWGVT